MGAFGEKLRQRREQRGLTLEAISNATKISPRMLLALEEERFDQLPGGVFNKGFVRAYARQLGLAEEETLTDYLAALRETQVQSQPILPDFRKSGHASPIAAPEPPSHAPLNSAAYDPVDEADNSEIESNPGNLFLDDLSDRRRGERRRSDRRDASHSHAPRPAAVPHSDFSVPAFSATSVRREIPTDDSAPVPVISRGKKIGAAVLLIIAVLGGWIMHRRHESPAFAPAAAPSTAAATTTASANAIASAHTPTPAAAAPQVTVPPKTTVHSATPPATEKADVTPPKPSAASASPSPAFKPAGAVAPPSSAPSHHTSVKAPATFTLTIRAEKTTWVSITSDGNPVAHETLIAPAHTSVRATSQIVVKAGNAAGVSFLLNGKEIPSPGIDGQVRTYTFNSTGLTPNAPVTPTSNR